VIKNCNYLTLGLHKVRPRYGKSESGMEIIRIRDKYPRSAILNVCDQKMSV